MPTPSTDRPRKKLYYGWVIVGAAFTANFAVTPMTSVVFAFFLVPIQEELGWSRSEVSWAFSLRLIAAGLAAPMIGLLVDRFGPRWIGVAAGLLAGGAIAGVSASNHLWLFYLLFIASGATGVGVAPGTRILTVVPVAKWFVAQRGRAMAIATTGVSGGAVMMIPVTQWLIEAYGWREALVILGVMLAALFAPAFGLFMRRTPEDMGLEPDGGAPSAPSDTAARAQPQQPDWTMAEALRTPTFWLVITAVAFGSFALTGTVVHRIAFWQEEIGISSGLVALGASLDPLTVSLSSLAFGFLGERVPPRVIGLIGGAGYGLSMLLMIFATDSAASIIGHNMVFGTAGGAWVTTNNLIWPAYFGRRALGTVQGITIPVLIIGMSLSAPGYGFLLDRGVSPSVMWTISLCLFGAAGALLFLTRRPEHPSARGEAV